MIMLLGIEEADFLTHAVFAEDGESVTIGTTTIRTPGHQLTMADFVFPE